ncbi:GTP-binding protein-like protein [Biscogniauxia marginata]|nr:GTP-binding protein-like protein [Biscogniauxia marginata]
MEILNWVYSFMGFFGLLNKKIKILILGLNKAGKSTLLMQMAHHRPEGPQPTLHSTSEELVIHNVRFVAINSADHQRFVEVKAELDALLATKEMQAIPIVVLGNKIDHLYAVSEEELRYELDLEHFYTRPIKLCMCSLAFRQGYEKALRWLTDHI